MVIQSNYFLFLGLPFMGLYLGTKFAAFPELYKGPSDCAKGIDGGLLWEVELYGIEGLWWVVLGILSSIGFGTGLHSGIMFLFPHLMTVVFAGESCGGFAGMTTMYNHPCKFQCGAKASEQPAMTFFDIWLRACLPFMLWGFGTAVGELPPYFVSLAASRTQGSRDEEFDKELEDAQTKNDPFNQLKRWTINVTEKYGFLGVFLLASWPNA